MMNLRMCDRPQFGRMTSETYSQKYFLLLSCPFHLQTVVSLTQRSEPRTQLRGEQLRVLSHCAVSTPVSLVEVDQLVRFARDSPSRSSPTRPRCSASCGFGPLWIYCKASATFS